MWVDSELGRLNRLSQTGLISVIHFVQDLDNSPDMSPPHHLWVHSLLIVHSFEIHLGILIGPAEPEILLGIRISSDLSIPHIVGQVHLTREWRAQMLWREETCNPRTRSRPFIHALLHWHHLDLCLRWCLIDRGHSSIGHGMGHISWDIEGLEERHRMRCRCGRHVENWKRI